MIKKGDRVKNDLSQKVYKVSMVKKEWILLEEEDGLNQVLTGQNSIGLSFQMIKDEDVPINFTPKMKSGEGRGRIIERLAKILQI